MKKASRKTPHTKWFHLYETKSQTQETSPNLHWLISQCFAISFQQPLRAISSGGRHLLPRIPSPNPPLSTFTQGSHCTSSMGSCLTHVSPQKWLCPSSPETLKTITPVPMGPSNPAELLTNILSCSQATGCLFCQIKDWHSLHELDHSSLPAHDPLSSFLVAVSRRQRCRQHSKISHSKTQGLLSKGCKRRYIWMMCCRFVFKL